MKFIYLFKSFIYLNWVNILYSNYNVRFIKNILKQYLSLANTIFL